MSSMIGSVIGGAMGTVGTIFGAVAGMKADKKLSKLQREDPAYTESPYVKQRLSLAQALLNARMPGATAMEQNVYANQANTTSNLQRNATDSSQLLALGAGVQGQTNDAFGKLGLAEAGDYYNRLQNLVGAQEGATEEHRNLFDDALRRWQDKVNINQAQYAMRQQGAQNFINLGGSVGGSVSSMGGGMGSSGGGGSQSPSHW